MRPCIYSCKKGRTNYIKNDVDLIAKMLKELPLECVRMVLCHLSILDFIEIVETRDMNPSSKMLIDLIEFYGMHRALLVNKKYCPIYLDQFHVEEQGWQIYVTQLDLSQVTPSITVQGRDLDCISLETICSSFKNLEILSLRGSIIVNNGELEVPVEFPRLERLRSLDMSEIQGSITHWSGSGQCHFIISAPSLFSLNLSRSFHLSDAELVAIPNWFPMLQSLYLESTHLAPETLVYIFRQLTDLSLLDISDNPSITVQDMDQFLASSPRDSPTHFLLIAKDCPNLTRSCIDQLKSAYEYLDVVHNSILAGHTEEDIAQYILSVFCAAQ